MLKLPVKGSIFSPCDRPSSSTFPDRRPFSVSMKPVKYFFGRKLAFDFPKKIPANRSSHAAPVEMTLTIAKAMRWWEKGIQPNMMEIGSAQELVETLSAAGDKLVIVDFFSPGCAGCRALHPKICQFAEKNSDVLFLQVNYEMHKSMCYSLNVHVLPFFGAVWAFRFYRGAHGRLCSFSCTVATIKKFKDAFAKHSTDRCSIGPVKGLEESELLALAANKDLRFNYTKKEEVLLTGGEVMEPVSVFDLSPVSISLHGLEEKTLAATGR